MSLRVSLVAVTMLAGCTAPARSVTAIFPPGSTAAPWVLQQDVWTGRLEEAAPALGDDAAFWYEHGSVQVWLAVYCHEELAERCLKVRCFALPSRGAARAAFDELRPLEAPSFKYGEVGCWTEIGVLLQWGRLVLEVFGGEASWSSQVQAALLATFIVQRMPAGLAENPR